MREITHTVSYVRFTDEYSTVSYPTQDNGYPYFNLYPNPTPQFIWHLLRFYVIAVDPVTRQEHALIFTRPYRDRLPSSRSCTPAEPEAQIVGLL